MFETLSEQRRRWGREHTARLLRETGRTAAEEAFKAEIDTHPPAFLEGWQEAILNPARYPDRYELAALRGGR